MSEDITPAKFITAVARELEPILKKIPGYDRYTYKGSWLEGNTFMLLAADAYGDRGFQVYHDAKDKSHTIKIQVRIGPYEGG